MELNQVTAGAGHVRRVATTQARSGTGRALPGIYGACTLAWRAHARLKWPEQLVATCLCSILICRFFSTLSFSCRCRIRSFLCSRSLHNEHNTAIYPRATSLAPGQLSHHHLWCYPRSRILRLDWHQRRTLLGGRIGWVRSANHCSISKQTNSMLCKALILALTVTNWPATPTGQPHPRCCASSFESAS